MFQQFSKINCLYQQYKNIIFLSKFAFSSLYFCFLQKDQFICTTFFFVSVQLVFIKLCSIRNIWTKKTLRFNENTFSPTLINYSSFNQPKMLTKTLLKKKKKKNCRLQFGMNLSLFNQHFNKYFCLRVRWSSFSLNCPT